MFRTDTIAGSWSELLARLSDRDALTGWGLADPRLAGLADVDRDLLPVLAEGRCPARADEITAALAQLAAAHGGDDLDAMSLLLHLCSGWVGTLCRQLADLTPDIQAVVVSELALQLRCYPWQRRRGSTMANLRMDTKHAVLREFRPALRSRGTASEVVLAPSSELWSLLDARTPAPGPGDGEDIDIVDLLVWAAASGVDEADLALLVRTEQARADWSGPGSAAVHVAAQFGMSEASSRRRRRRTLIELRCAAERYLAAA